MQDVNFLNKIQKFDRERITPRQAHAQGKGAYGYFELTHDMSKYTKACMFNGVGKKTQAFARMSTTIGDRESSDLLRDVRGFAWKFYTEEGNYDMVGINTPVFFLQDIMKGPDMFHSLRRHPIKGYYDVNTNWDFFANNPESMHMVTMIWSDYGVPYGYRHMNGYGAHTFKWVNAQGEVFFVKYTFKTDQGVKNFAEDERRKMMGVEPYFAARDLHEALDRGEFPSWTMYV